MNAKRVSTTVGTARNASTQKALTSADVLLVSCQTMAPIAAQVSSHFLRFLAGEKTLRTPQLM